MMVRRGPRMVTREDVGAALAEHEYRERLRAQLVAKADAKRDRMLEQERRWLARRDRRRTLVARLLGRR